MVKKLHVATPPTFGVDLINELVENFGRCPKWSGRQAFVFVCQVSEDLPICDPFLCLKLCFFFHSWPLNTLFLIPAEQSFARWLFTGSPVPWSWVSALPIPQPSTRGCSGSTAHGTCMQMNVTAHSRSAWSHLKAVCLQGLKILSFLF